MRIICIHSCFGVCNDAFTEVHLLTTTVGRKNIELDVWLPELSVAVEYQGICGEGDA